MQDDDVAWWVDSGATVHVCKDRCRFNTYESLNDGSILHMRNESTALVYGRGCVDLSHLRIEESLRAQDNDKPKRNNVAGPSVVNMDDDVAWWVDSGATVHVCKDRFRFNTYESLNDASILHMRNESTTLVFGRGCVDLSDLCDLHATPSLGNKKYVVTFIDDDSRVPNKRNKITPYELWTKRKQNLNYLSVWGRRAAVRLPDLKLKTLGERGIECIFVGYVEHSKAFKFYVIKPNDSVAINTIIDSMDVIFDENRFSSIPRPSQRSLDDPQTFNEAMRSQDVAFWKEAINDEMDSIMGNNIGVLTDLPPGCRPLGCKWIFKRKQKVDGTVEKFKARLVIQGFNQKSGTEYFDTYAPVARISTIRLLIAIASTHNLIIHQMDVKTAFLNGDLEEEVYMNQPLGFIMSGNENKVDLTKKFLSSRFSMKDMGEAAVILGIRIKHESNGIAIS
nr:zinc finger, CCHC-type [Tanacetum cinerariifolium]